MGLGSVSQKTVDQDEQGMRLDRWFKVHFPGLGFGKLQKLLRSGQIRVDGGRVKSASRLEAGQVVRIPPLDAASADTPQHMTKNTMRDRHDADVLRDMVLYEDNKVFVFNKPSGLAVQGGSGISRSVDSMLESLRDRSGQKPRLCHRLDRDTSGVLVVAKTRGAAAALTKSFRHRDTQKTYWALVRGVPRHREGRISTYLVKEKTEDGDRMRVARHGERGADHAVGVQDRRECQEQRDAHDHEREHAHDDQLGLTLWLSFACAPQLDDHCDQRSHEGAGMRIKLSNGRRLVDDVIRTATRMPISKPIPTA